MFSFFACCIFRFQPFKQPPTKKKDIHIANPINPTSIFSCTVSQSYIPPDFRCLTYVFEVRSYLLTFRCLGSLGFFWFPSKVTRKSANNHPKMHSAAPEKQIPKSSGFPCYFPRKLQHTPISHTPGNPLGQL